MEAALIGLAGVLLGGGLTQGFNLWTEKRRWAHEDRLRFTDDKRRVYSKYAGIMDIASITTERGPEVMQLVHDSSYLFSEIRLIGGDRVIKAAYALWNFIAEYVDSVPDSAEMAKYLNAFNVAARDEIVPPSEN